MTAARPANSAFAWFGSRTAALALLLGLLVGGSGAFHPAFMAPANLRDIALAAAPVIVLALGGAFVVLTGEIDISVGSLYGLVLAVFGRLAAPSRGDLDPLLAALAVLALGGAAGLVNGLLVAYGRVPSIIATLGTMTIGRGLIEWTLGGAWITDIPAQVRSMSATSLAGIPVAVLAALLATAVGAAIVGRTPFGLRLRAVGSNPSAARLTGLSPEALRVAAFVLSGLSAAVAALLSAPNLAVIDSGLGQGLELVVVTAVVVGGISIRGGAGELAAVAVAALLLGTVRTVLVFLKLGPSAAYWERAVFGVMILAAVLFDPGRQGRRPPPPIVEADVRRLDRQSIVRGLVGLALLALVALMVEPEFLGGEVQGSLLGLIAEIALVAIPATLIVIAGGIDLSVGSAMALAAVVGGLIFEKGGSLWLGSAAALGTGAAAGLLNGILAPRSRLHPLIVTLATLSLFRGLAEGISGGRVFSTFPEALTGFGTAELAFLPAVVLPSIILLIAAALVFGRGRIGRELRAVGYAETACRMSGIAVDRLRVTLYVASGAAAGGAALLFMARRHTAKADIGVGLELEVVTALVLGGTSVAGGRGTLLGTVLGVLFLHELRQFVAWEWARDEVVLMVLGSVLVAGVLIERRLALRPAFRKMHA